LSGTSYNGSSAVTIAIDSTVATLTGAQTLTNKSIALGSNTVTGTISQFNSALTDGDFATLAGSETLTNKSISLSSNTLTGNISQFNTALSDGDFATLAGSETLTNKTLTAPRISTGSNIADANGNELIVFPTAVGSAVNEVTISNAATGSAPSISASGGDTNINLVFNAKGTGTVKIGSRDVARKYAETMTTSSTSIVVTHNLGTEDVTVAVKEVASPYAIVYPDIEITTANTVTIKFATAPASNTYRVVVVG
jgi:hypothetical protein